jgi:hypothetical protein
MNPNTGDWKTVSGYARSIESTDYAYDVTKNMYYVVAGGDVCTHPYPPPFVSSH